MVDVWSVAVWVLIVQLSEFGQVAESLVAPKGKSIWSEGPESVITLEDSSGTTRIAVVRKGSFHSNCKPMIPLFAARGLTLVS
jgi:hypothetical protein